VTPRLLVVVLLALGVAIGAPASAWGVSGLGSPGPPVVAQLPDAQADLQGPEPEVVVLHGTAARQVVGPRDAAARRAVVAAARRASPGAQQTLAAAVLLAAMAALVAAAVPPRS